MRKLLLSAALLASSALFAELFPLNLATTPASPVTGKVVAITAAEAGGTIGDISIQRQRYFTVPDFSSSTNASGAPAGTFVSSPNYFVLSGDDDGTIPATELYVVGTNALGNVYGAANCELRCYRPVVGGITSPYPKWELVVFQYAGETRNTMALYDTGIADVSASSSSFVLTRKDGLSQTSVTATKRNERKSFQDTFVKIRVNTSVNGVSALDAGSPIVATGFSSPTSEVLDWTGVSTAFSSSTGLKNVFKGDVFYVIRGSETNRTVGVTLMIDTSTLDF